MTARTIAGLAGLVAVLAACPTGATAQTASKRAQQTYDCVASNGQGTRNEQLGLGITLDVPASVTAGSSLSLRGTIDVRVPDTYSEGVSQFDVKWVDAVSDTINAKVTVGERTFLHPADRWTTGRQPAKTPVVPSGPVTFPAIPIPADARGSVTIRMPGNGFTKNTLAADPPMVAFVARATVYWTMEWSFAWACHLPGEPNVIATIPIAPPATAAAAEPRTTAAAPVTGSAKSRTSTTPRSDTPSRRTEATTPSTTGAPSLAAATGSSSTKAAAKPSTGGSPTQPEAAPTAATADAAATPTSAAPTVMANTASTRNGVRLPAEGLWIAGLVTAALLAAWAAHLHRRVRLLERDDD